MQTRRQECRRSQVHGEQAAIVMHRLNEPNRDLVAKWDLAQWGGKNGGQKYEKIGNQTFLPP